MNFFNSYSARCSLPRSAMASAQLSASGLHPDGSCVPRVLSLFSFFISSFFSIEREAASRVTLSLRFVTLCDVSAERNEVTLCDVSLRFSSSSRVTVCDALLRSRYRCWRFAPALFRVRAPVISTAARATKPAASDASMPPATSAAINCPVALIRCHTPRRRFSERTGQHRGIFPIQ